LSGGGAPGESGVLHDAVIRLGHDVVRQFAHRGQADAVEEVSAHLLKFWEPRMRAELRRCVARRDHQLEPLLVDAVSTWPDEGDTQADRRAPSGG
jgi:formate dehydrogenase subunit delta